jgi:DNA-binding CsgD family transcriptional regulator
MSFEQGTWEVGHEHAGEPPAVGSSRRQQAVSVDEAEGRPHALGAVWLELVRGNVKILDAFSLGERSYLLLTPVDPGEQRALPAVQLRAFEAVIGAGNVKVAAFDLERSAGVVVHRLCRALAAFGLRCPLSRAPALLVLTAHAGLHAQTMLQARLAETEYGGRDLLVVSIERPDLAVRSLLTPAEHDVVRRLADGGTHAEIASGRRCALRTVANQMSSILRKLRAGNRLELIFRMAPAAEPVRAL